MLNLSIVTLIHILEGGVTYIDWFNVSSGYEVFLPTNFGIFIYVGTDQLVTRKARIYFQRKMCY